MHAGPSRSLELSRVPTFLNLENFSLYLSSSSLIVILMTLYSMIAIRVAMVATFMWPSSTTRELTMPCLKVFIPTLQVLVMTQATANTRPLRPPKSKSKTTYKGLVRAYKKSKKIFNNSLLAPLLLPIINTYTPTLAVSSMQMIAALIGMTNSTQSTMQFSLLVMAPMKPLA